jgi:CTP synthase (UTP-ammonia lyase)
MRLGSYPAVLKENSKVASLYGKTMFQKDIGIDMKLIMNTLKIRKNSDFLFQENFQMEN